MLYFLLPMQASSSSVTAPGSRPAVGIPMYNIPMSTVLVGGPPPAPYTPVAAADSTGSVNAAISGVYPSPGPTGPEGCHSPPYSSPPPFPMPYYHPPPGMAPMSHPYSQYAYLPYTAQQTGARVEGMVMPYPVYQYPPSRPNSTTPIPQGGSSSEPWTGQPVGVAAGPVAAGPAGGGLLRTSSGRRIEEEAPASGGATPTYAAVAVESPTHSSTQQAAAVRQEAVEAASSSHPAAPVATGSPKAQAKQ